MFEVDDDTLIVPIIGTIPSYIYDAENYEYYEINSPQYLRQAISVAKNKGLKKIILNINSNGGYFMYAIDMFNTIHYSPIEIEARNMGNAQSAAAIILLAAATTAVAEVSNTMFHTVSTIIWGTKYDLENELELLNRFNEMLKTCVKIKNRDITDEQLDKLFNAKDCNLNPQEMLELKLADKILNQTDFKMTFFGKNSKPIDATLENMKALMEEKTNLEAEFDRFKNEQKLADERFKNELAKAEEAKAKAEAEKAEAEKTKTVLEAKIATLEAEKQQLSNKVETLEKRVHTNNGFSSTTEPPKVPNSLDESDFGKELANRVNYATNRLQ